MKYFKIKQELTLQRVILFLQCHSSLFMIGCYILLSLVVFSIEIKNNSYFDTIKGIFLDSKIVKVAHLPSKGMSNIIGSISHFFTLQKENERLRLSNRISLFELSKLQKENIELRWLLKFTIANDITVITTPIAWTINNGFANYGIINIGLSQGIRNGQAVISKHGLVGRIAHVSEDRARILFIHNANFRTSVKMLSNGKEAIVTGTNDKEILKLIYIDNEAQLHDGDYVVTAGDFPNFPSGVLVGRFKAPKSVITEIDWYHLGLVGVVALEK